ncbi:uncharacterized protein LOC142159382 isoform X1 [Mixophyes fleayi]|uniref:uncharacterized protein LOC142159382 isoform X1 n=1 Tax=Mixophyes fleayi TaxID=3061075 RepID=UPI003F4D74CE
MERPLLSESLAKVTFDDAAVYFSEEQWQNLEDFQKKIYKELIKEIYETMLALGYRIPKPEIVCRIERGEEPCIDTCKKPKLQGSQPEGGPAGSKDSEPVIKVERESPEASIPYHPSEISSSQERNGSQCTRCGTYCNNQCVMGFQWNTQGMYTVSPMDRNHGKQYVTPPPPYFNGNPVSPGFVNRGEGMPLNTSPRSTYGNVGMVPLSPHYAGYRNTGDAGSQFPVPDRSGNPMFANFELNQPTQMGPPGSYVDHQNRCTKEQYPHVQDTSFQERRNTVAPCPSCGGFCNNRCRMSIPWEQRRLHHLISGVVEGGQATRYASPPNPYFNGVANSSFPNVRPPVRHGTSPVNVQGNPAMIQLSPQYAGYRRPGDPKSPDVLPGKLEHSAGNAVHGSNATASSPLGQHQSNNYGTVPANSSGYHRKTQSMSPLAAIETMPMFTTNNSPSNVNDQRNRPSAQTVTSSDSNKDRGAMHRNTSRKPDHLNFSIQGNRINRVLQPTSPATGNTGQPKSGEVTGNRNSSPSANVGHTARNTQPSSSTLVNQDVGWVAASESYGVKRAAPQAASDSGLPTKRASPPVIIVDCQGGKHTSTLSSGGNNQGSSSVTPPSTKSGSLPSAPSMVYSNQDPRKTTPHETKDGRRPTPPITISNIRSAGIFMPPAARAKKDTNIVSSPIIIIDDKDGDTGAPRSSPAGSSNKEVKRSTSGTPPVANSKISGELPPSLVNKVSPQGGQQAPQVMVNKVQMQQPSPIIVTGGNQPLPVPVNGNPSIMWTFPVTVGSSGIMLATPVNITEKQISGIKQTNRVPISKNPRLVQTNTVPLNTTSGNVNAKFGPMAVIGQTNTLPVAVPPGQPKPITVNFNQSGNIASSLNIRNSNLQKANGGTLKAVPVTTSGNQAMAQTIPLFVDANSGLILTGSAVPSKDNVSSGIGNATVVTVNGGMVTGNVAPVTLGGKLAFRNITPVNVNKFGNTTFFTVDRAMGIRNGSPVTLTNNATNFNNKGTLSINNPTILTLNGGLPIGNSGAVGAPIANIASVNANGTLQVAPSTASAVVGGAGQQNNGIIIRRVGEPSVAPQAPSNEQAPVVSERLFKCSECDEKFNSLENLASHQSVHKQPDIAPGKASEPNAKCGETEVLPGVVDEDAPTILYTTQGDDGSTVYVVTV